MSHNILSQAQLNRFYDSRKQLDLAIGQILGNDIHLHDISHESDKSLQFTNSFAKRDNIVNTINNNNINNGNRKNPQLFNNFYTSVSNESKMEKLYKENVELQKKMMNIKEENQNYKHKAYLWQKIKQYIIDSFDGAFKLKSIKFGSSDAAILDQFLITVEELIAKSKKINNIDGSVDHTVCRELFDDCKKKLQTQIYKNSKLLMEIDLLTNQNKILKEKENYFKSQRKLKINQLQQGINQKFQTIDSNLLEKSKENLQLKKIISSLESEIYQLKNIPSSKKGTNKTSSTHHQLLKLDNSQAQLLRKISKGKDQQIQKLKRQSQELQNETNKIKMQNQKMKNAIKLAQILNNEFLSKIQTSMKLAEKNQLKNINPLSASQYNLGGNSKVSQIEKDFHLVNQRFKIVKTRSLQKQKFQYGERRN